MIDKIISDYLKRKVPVTIVKTDESWDAGDWHWAISVNENPEFWLDAFKYLDLAVDFCKINGLPYKEEQI